MNATGKRGEGIAAFFDVDGTLVASPSLERRFFSELRERGLVPPRNYFFWLAHAGRLLAQGIGAIQHADKMYLRGVRADYQERRAGTAGVYRDGVERLAWHAEQGHAIFLVSGTLLPLAQRVALEIVMRLAGRGITAAVGVCATRLEERDGCWTGRIVGEAVFGEGKVRAARRLAREHALDLERCFAYGDAASDQSMLDVVGRPAAVNPSADLERMARRAGWPVLWWDRDAKELRRGSLSSRRAQRDTEALVD